MTITFPNSLVSNDVIALIAPAGKATLTMIKNGERVFKEYGFHTKLGKSIQAVTDSFYAFAGTDEARKNDLQMALNDPEVRAIVCVRGGYGVTRILDDLDFTAFKKSPKWIVGFSDMTALHLKVQQLGFASIHGTMPTQFDKDDIAEALCSLKNTLSGYSTYVESVKMPFFREGNVEATVIGGNLSLVVNSLGTPTEIDTEGKILLLEEIGESPYAVDRMLGQLRRAGKLKNLAGLVCGTFTDGKTEYEADERDVVCVLKGYFDNADFPVATRFPIGHTAYNQSVVLGGTYELSVWAGHGRMMSLFGELPF